MHREIQAASFSTGIYIQIIPSHYYFMSLTRDYNTTITTIAAT
jgi:hypothetical protein